MSLKQKIEEHFALCIAVFCIVAFVAGWAANQKMHSAARAEIKAKEAIVDARSAEFQKELDELKSQLVERNSVLLSVLDAPGSYGAENGVVISPVQLEIVGKDGKKKSLTSKLYVGDAAVASLGYRTPADKAARIYVRLPEVTQTFEPSASLASPGFLARKIKFQQKGRTENLIIEFIMDDGELAKFEIPMKLEVL